MENVYNLGRSCLKSEQACADLLGETVRALGLFARESFLRPSGGDMFLLKGFAPFISSVIKYANDHSSQILLVYTVILP